MRTLGVILLVILGLLTSPPFDKKPKPVVELYALDTSHSPHTGIYTLDAYLILPDGSHAHGRCDDLPRIGTDVKCMTPEPSNAATRSPDACKPKPCTQEPGSPEMPDACKHCVYREKYPADRKGNDITLYAANGKIGFHIEDSW